jgi:hypothetical protein
LGGSCGKESFREFKIKSSSLEVIIDKDIYKGVIVNHFGVFGVVQDGAYAFLPCFPQIFLRRAYAKVTDNSTLFFCPKSSFLKKRR